MGSSAGERRAARRVLGLAAVAALGAAVLTAGWLTDLDPLGGVSLAWPVLAAAFFCTEICLVHFEHRRESHAVTFSAVPLVVGLYTVDPLALVGARLLGSVAALVGYHRQAPVKVVTNAASCWLETATAVVVFHALVDGAGVSVSTWPAAFAAAVVADLVQAVVITAAISLYQDRLEVLGAPALLGPVASVANTSLALLAVSLLVAEPAALALLAALLPILLVSYRVHARLREKHHHLEELYDFSREVGEAVLRGGVVAALLGRVQELMHAESAWLVAAGGDGLVRVTAADADGTGSPVAGDGPDAELHRLAQEAGGPTLLDARSGGGRVAAALQAAGVTQALVAPLLRLSGLPATLVVADRSGRVRPFGPDDLTLFATLVNHAGASLENSTLLERLREHAAASEHQSLHDPLTGLPNRLLFGRRLAEALDAGGLVAVLLIDLDRFKEVNDALGHHNGDVLLEEVGRRLRRSLRAGDTVARLGGDEFAILLPDLTGADAAVHVARGALAVLREPFAVADVVITVDASVGITFAPDHGRDPATLLQRADVAMYTAKADQSRVELYRPERHQHSADRLALAGELRRAIDRRELTVHYQPQMDLVTGAVVGAEALVRWPAQPASRLSPGEMVSLAEQTGLIGSLTSLVLEQAVTQLRVWREQGWDIRMSVNVSARTLLEERFVDEVRSALAAAGLPPAVLCLELTETSIMHDQQRMVEMLERLRGVGVTIAVDDFGVGYSSLAYLKRLPVGEIKIDKSFVISMEHAPSDEAIVRSVVDLARNLGLPVVAEGVESAAAAATLRALGCRLAQGYHFSRPLPALEFTTWLSGQAARHVPAGVDLSTTAVPPGD